MRQRELTSPRVDPASQGVCDQVAPIIDEVSVAIVVPAGGLDIL
ncbi:MAG: hypothetical protein ACLSH6_08430 [Limosilactobacillus pontis]